MTEYAHLEYGDVIEFEYDGRTRQGSVLQAGPRRIHVKSGKRGVYVTPDDVRCIVHKPAANEVPVMGETFRLSGGVDQ